MLLAEHLIEVHVERGQRGKEGRQQLQKTGEKPCWDDRRCRSPYFDVWPWHRSGRRLHLPMRDRAQDRWHEQRNPGEAAPGDVVGSQELELCLLHKSRGLGWHGLFIFLIGLMLMLSPAPWWADSPGSYSSQKGARFVPLLPWQFRPTFWGGSLFCLLLRRVWFIRLDTGLNPKAVP